MKHRGDEIAGYAAILLAVIFVIVGIWFNVLQPDEPGSQIPCEYGFTENCDP